LNDYERRINNIVREKYLEGLTIQPFIIIHASPELEFLDFFVFFDKSLLKCVSFLKSIDLSYSLSYPKASEQAWYAVQKIVAAANAPECSGVFWNVVEYSGLRSRPSELV